MTSVQTCGGALEKESYSAETLNLAYDKFISCVSQASKELLATLEVPFSVLFGETFSAEFAIAIEGSSQKYIADIDSLLKTYIAKANESPNFESREFSKAPLEVLPETDNEEAYQNLVDTLQDQTIVDVEPENDAEDHSQYINIVPASVVGTEAQTFYTNNGQTFDVSTEKIVLDNVEGLPANKVRYVTILRPKSNNVPAGTTQAAEVTFDSGDTGHVATAESSELHDNQIQLQLDGRPECGIVPFADVHTDTNVIDERQGMADTETELERGHIETTVHYVSDLQAEDMTSEGGQILEMVMEHTDLEHEEHFEGEDTVCATSVPLGSIAVKCDDAEAKLVESAIAAETSAYEPLKEESGFIWDEDERKRGRSVFTNVNADKEDVDFEYSVAPMSRKKAKRKALEPGAKPGWPCEICGDVLATKVALTRHFNFAHPSIGKWRCAVCSEILPSMKKLNLHFKTEHATEGLYCCPVCGFSFKCHQTFQEHFSGCTFTPEDAGFHEQKPSVLDSVEDEGQETEKIDPTRPFECKFCSRRFQSKGILTSHITQRHLIYTPGSTNSCDVCEKRFTKPYYYVKHCDTPTHVKKMREKYGVSGEDEQGPQDPNVYTNLADTNIKRRKRKKKGEKESDELNICDVCGRSDFSSKSNLYIHIRTHTKPFECDFCGKRFADKKHMRAHRRLHTGETPFMCDLCGKSFREKYLLRNHTSQSHSNKVYKCNDCQIMFKYKRNLYMHMKKKHGVVKFEMFESSEFEAKDVEVKIENFIK